MISAVAENRRLKGIAAQVTAPPALADIEDVAAASCASCPHAHHQAEPPAGADAAADGVRPGHSATEPCQAHREGHCPTKRGAGQRRVYMSDAARERASAVRANLAAGKPPPPRGLERKLANYGDAGFSVFLRKAFIKAMGYTEDALSRPIVGITNTFSGALAPGSAACIGCFQLLR